MNKYLLKEIKSVHTIHSGSLKICPQVRASFCIGFISFIEHLLYRKNDHGNYNNNDNNMIIIMHFLRLTLWRN